MTKARECGDKQALTKVEAQKQAEWWRRRRFTRMEPYRCRHCGSWHIGNRSAPARRRVKW